jgi:hypothetical protein
MEPLEGLQSLIEHLEDAQKVLQTRAYAHPALNRASRTLRRAAEFVARPFRLAVLGESNSGKSTIANLIGGQMTLPALPVANTRLPTLLRYASAPSVTAIYKGGVSLAVAPGDELSLQNIMRLDVGLPNDTFRSIEVLDFPGSANPLFPADVSAVLQHRIDAAIWATVATQAWRETERQAWSKLPQRIRRRGILAVTHADLIRSETDAAKLKARLQTVQQAHFHALCFVAGGAGGELAGNGSHPHPAAELFSEVERLSTEFHAGRAAKTVVLARRVATQALADIER